MTTDTTLVPYTLPEEDLVLEHGEQSYVLRLRDLPLEKRPREKLIAYGPSSLSLGELLAVILNAGSKKEEVFRMANRILKEYGEQAIMHERNPKKLQELLDIPLVKSCQIVACFELGRRFFKDSRRRPAALRTARQVYEYLKDMRELPKEQLRGLYLDSRYQVVHDEVISVGSLTANIIHPREVLRPAIEFAAVAVILAHNHPSGVAKPSNADILVTKQLIEAGKIIGIHVLDHIIITKRSFTSVPADYTSAQ